MQDKLPSLEARRPRRTALVEKEPLQVRIPVSVKRKFKTYAAMHGLEPNELFVQVWRHFEETKISVTTATGGRI
jgi:hypothetical protein